MQQLERFVVLLYDRTSTEEGSNLARKQLFSKKGRAIVGLPPTLAALIEHTKRAADQAGHCWGQTMTPAPKLPTPNDWGWKKKASGGWDVMWTTLPEASKACRNFCVEGERSTANVDAANVIRCL